ncbi:hypothetical protein [Brazilian porcupinepox virus 1]|nr:hypothetical protein [Brazilian porcupinepox virus 1]
MDRTMSFSFLSCIVISLVVNVYGGFDYDYKKEMDYISRYLVDENVNNSLRSDCYLMDNDIVGTYYGEDVWVGLPLFYRRYLYRNITSSDRVKLEWSFLDGNETTSFPLDKKYINKRNEVFISPYLFRSHLSLILTITYLDFNNTCDLYVCVIHKFEGYCITNQYLIGMNVHYGIGKISNYRSIEWYKNGNPIKNNTENYLVINNNLYINNATLDNSGTYTYKIITNKNESYFSKMCRTLKINDKSHYSFEQVKLPSEAYVTVGENFTINCTLIKDKGTAYAYNDWTDERKWYFFTYLDYRVYKYTDRYSKDNKDFVVDTLIIEPVEESDIGRNYTCISKSLYNTIESVVTLKRLN